MSTERTIDATKVNPSATAEGDAKVMLLSANGGFQPVTLDTLVSLVKGNIHIGGRNLLKNSGTPKSGVYGIGPYEVSELLIEGKTYTVTAYDVAIGAGKDDFLALWDSTGSFRLSELKKVDDGVYSGTFVAPARVATTTQYSVYSAPLSGNITTVGKTKLERGNIPTDWTPAPEDVADLSQNRGGGGKIHIPNLLHFSTAICGERSAA